jgi:hypothetical protein
LTAENAKISVSEHALAQAARRGLSEAVVFEVARAPEQRLPVRQGREIRQSRVTMPEGVTLCLVRVVVDIGPNGETVVTAYRTSKIDKYWSSHESELRRQD